MEMDAVFENELSESNAKGIREKHLSLTPSTFDDNISMIAMKGSITLSIEDTDDELGITMSGLTTPLVSVDEVESLDIPRMHKKTSLLDEGELDQTKEISALHASINIPAASCQFLKHDARLRKFETITQSTSNSNFPFESNTLKRDPKNVKEFIDVMHTQSCINLKTSASQTPIVSIDGNRESDELRENLKERPKSISREFHGKTQSMDSDLLFNEFLLIPTHPTRLHQSTSKPTKPSTKRNEKNRFTTAKVEDDYYKK